jgi:hypothetical protein
VSSMYDKLSQGATVADFKVVWAAKLPLKIKIFSWQLVLDRLPSSIQIAIRQGPATGTCALCGAPEDSSHILFTCSLAKFTWSVTHQLFGCSGCPGKFCAVLCHCL